MRTLLKDRSKCLRTQYEVDGTFNAFPFDPYFGKWFNLTPIFQIRPVVQPPISEHPPDSAHVKELYNRIKRHYYYVSWNWIESQVFHSWSIVYWWGCQIQKHREFLSGLIHRLLLGVGSNSYFLYQYGNVLILEAAPWKLKTFYEDLNRMMYAKLPQVIYWREKTLFRKIKDLMLSSWR